MPSPRFSVVVDYVDTRKIAEVMGCSRASVQIWLQEIFGIILSVEAVYFWLKSFGAKLRVPRPVHIKKNPQAPTVFHPRPGLHEIPCTSTWCASSPELNPSKNSGTSSKTVSATPSSPHSTLSTTPSFANWSPLRIRKVSSNSLVTAK
ncbi:MAG TPA: winged helix-turn-helix domain-containing protein [Candidatus Methylacidiphilales bacterium]|nr:winged helix-turn-helix domain-containing protein [Candidatus Methylacidiphilales bacterium]